MLGRSPGSSETLAEFHRREAFKLCPVAPCSHGIPPPPVENGAFFCNECDCRFSEEASLKRHTLQTHSDKPYKCDRCQASFRYKGNLASHKTVHTGMALSQAECSITGYRR